MPRLSLLNPHCTKPVLQFANFFWRMNSKQQLLLYLIANHPSLQGIYQLVKTFDRVNFPSEISTNLEPLLKKELIEVDKLFDNNTPASYRATRKGLEYLNKSVITENLIQYVKTYDYPDQLLLALNVQNDTEQRTTFGF